MRPRESGSVSLEVVLLTPVLLVLIGLIVMSGRVGDVRAAVVDATHQAARAATMTSDATSARSVAEDTALANLETQEVACLEVTVEVDTSRFGRGGDVGVTVRCVLDLSALAFAGLPGSRTVTAQATEVIDVYRGGP